MAPPGELKGTIPIIYAQRGEKYGQDLPVLAGSYDVYVDLTESGQLKIELVSEKLEVKAGQVTEVD